MPIAKTIPMRNAYYATTGISPATRTIAAVEGWLSHNAFVHYHDGNVMGTMYRDATTYAISKSRLDGERVLLRVMTTGEGRMPVGLESLLSHHGFTPFAPRAVQKYACAKN